MASAVGGASEDIPRSLPLAIDGVTNHVHHDKDKLAEHVGEVRGTFAVMGWGSPTEQVLSPPYVPISIVPRLFGGSD